MLTNFNNSFDTTNALFALFLWLLFGFLSHMINCDLQRMIKQSAAIRHVIGLTAFFFLFTVIDGSNKDASVGAIFAKTFLVYILFIFTTKSKWYFTLPVLGLLMYDQVAKKWYEDKKNERLIRTKTGVPGEEQVIALTVSTDSTASNALDTSDIGLKAKRTNQIINVVVISVIVVGMLHYMYLQKLEYRRNFSLYKFFFETNKQCKQHYPTYFKK